MFFIIIIIEIEVIFYIWLIGVRKIIYKSLCLKYLHAFHEEVFYEKIKIYLTNIAN